MAVTALIKRLRGAAGQPSAADLGMDTGMQIPIQGRGDRKSGNRYLESPSLAQEFLVEFYPKLKKHFDWFRRTQRGQIKQYGRKARSRTEAYRWRGRSEKHVLTSGLDDYPRANASAGELHLDLISWMGFFTRTMRDIAGFMGNEDDETMFVDTEQAIIDNIDGAWLAAAVRVLRTHYQDLHWNEKEQMYCDVGLNDDGKLVPSDGQHLVAYTLQMNPYTYATKAISRSSQSCWD